MQLSVTLKSHRLTLPIASSYVIQGLLYKALSSDTAYALSLHEEGKQYDDRKFKLFTFSELAGKYETDGKTITYLSDAVLTVRAVDSYMIQLLFSYFSQNKTIQIENNLVYVADVELQDEAIFDETLRVKTLSPITVYQTEENGHTTYFAPDDPRFYNSIRKNARRKWCSYFGNGEDFSFAITPCENARFVKRATKFKETFITAWHGEFILQGNPKVLTFLHRTGLGSKNSQGFGMFEIVK